MDLHLFVYGTLRKDALGAQLSPLTRDWSFVGYGSVRGRLYDFGPYPGAVPKTEGTSWVRGELYRLPDSRTLARVDAYEGCGPGDRRPYEFEREQIDVTLEDGGQVVRAWIYWYRPSPPLGRHLPSGDYIERVSLDDGTP